MRFVAKGYILQQKMSEEVNRKFPARNTMVELLALYNDPESTMYSDTDRRKERRTSDIMMPYCVKVKVKADIALHGNPISELRDVTCHMGSHSVNCHPTQVNAPRLTPAMQAGTRFTYPGAMEG